MVRHAVVEPGSVHTLDGLMAVDDLEHLTDQRTVLLCSILRIHTRTHTIIHVRMSTSKHDMSGWSSIMMKHLNSVSTHTMTKLLYCKCDVIFRVMQQRRVSEYVSE